MPAAQEPIRYFDRYSGRVEEERVYGEAWVRWAYESGAGGLALELMVRRVWFSWCYGVAMRLPHTRRRIAPFVRDYGIDAAEFLHPPDSFGSFNAFFVRELKPQARPIAADAALAVFPADGRHRGYPSLSDAEGLWVKGEPADLAVLFDDASLAQRYRGGALVVSRLCPVDYHRFHFPVAGLPGPARALRGRLDSVSPIALRRFRRILFENRRYLTRLGSERWGEVACFEVGAACVGSVVQTYRGRQPVVKGEEKGYFQFGGSALLTLFEPGRIRLDDDLVAQTRAGIELYARMGDRMGRATSG